MEKERRIKVLSVVALIVAVLGLTVAFAALSQTLTINGFSGVYQDDWDIRIQGDDSYYEKANARTQNFDYINSAGNPPYGKFTLDVGEDLNTLNGFKFTLQKPGDVATLNFYVANYGVVDAELSEIINTEPVCTSSTGDEEDARLVCDNLIIKYGYPTAVSSASSTNIADWIDEFKVGDELLASQSDTSTDIITKSVNLIVQLDPELDTLPSSSVTVSNLGFKLVYTQKD